MNWDSLEGNCFQERMSILNAIYVPPGLEVALYDEISPINSFRAVLDGQFHTGLGRLEDRSYFSLWRTPYDLVDITDRVDTCEHRP